MAAIKCDRMDFFIAPSNLSYRLLGITKWKILWEIWGFRSESNVMNFTTHSSYRSGLFFFLLYSEKKMFALHFAVNLFLKYEALVIRYTHIYCTKNGAFIFKIASPQDFLIRLIISLRQNVDVFFCYRFVQCAYFFIPILCQISSCQYFMRKKSWCEMRYPCEVCSLLLLLKQICRFWSIMSWVFKGNVMNE